MLAKYAKDNGWVVFDYYVDDGYTGTNYNRPGFQRMIEDIEAGKINLVVVKEAYVKLKLKFCEKYFSLGNIRTALVPLSAVSYFISRKSPIPSK
jgi:hypothetical protein